MRDHPIIVQIERTGYPADMKEKSSGTDVFGNEVLAGDEIVILPNGEQILKDSLEDYLGELGYKFQTAE